MDNSMGHGQLHATDSPLRQACDDAARAACHTLEAAGGFSGVITRSFQGKVAQALRKLLNDAESASARAHAGSSSASPYSEAPAGAATHWFVVLLGASGAVRGVLDADGRRFVEPASSHRDPSSGVASLWFSRHQPVFSRATQELARRELARVSQLIGNPGMVNQLRVAAAREGEDGAFVIVPQARGEASGLPGGAETAMLSTQALKPYVQAAVRPDIAV